MKKNNGFLKDKNFFVSVKFSHDKEIQKLNKEYLDRDYPTDVLSFNMDQERDDGSYYLGDIVVNIDQAERQVVEYGNSLEEELADLVEHGVLHLLGVHHEEDENL